MTRRWLVTGASGQLGGYLLRQVRQQEPDAQLTALAGRGTVFECGAEVIRIGLEDEQALRACVRSLCPTHILHVGAMTSVAQACARPEQAERVNTHATRVLAEAAAECGARLVFASTDMVFDGTNAPYGQTDPPSPISHYGRTKAAAEKILLGFGNVLVVRLPLLYGFPLTERRTTFWQQVAALRGGQPVQLFFDEFRTPVSLADAARAVVGLARSEHCGLIHVAGPQRLSRYELIERVARRLSIAGPWLVPVSRLSAQGPEPRPADLSLDDGVFRREFPELAPGPVEAWEPESAAARGD
jgi:dTDP-4-dehydrorhamnose reductase